MSNADRAALGKLLPHMVRGSSALTRVLRKTPAARPAVRVVPAVVRKTAKALRKRVVAGKPVTRRIAAKIMANQTRKTLASPHKCAMALTKNKRASRVVKTAKRRLPHRVVRG
jgi:hypothetical protein